MRRPIDKLVLVVEAAFEKYTSDLFDNDDAHEDYCMCHDCLFARGIRGELIAFAKAEAKAGKAAEAAASAAGKAAKRSGSAPAGAGRRRAAAAAPAAPPAREGAAPPAPGAAPAARRVRRPRAP